MNAFNNFKRCFSSVWFHLVLFCSTWGYQGPISGVYLGQVAMHSFCAYGR